MTERDATTSLVQVREIEAQGKFRIGHATLNAEKALNALSLDMVGALDAALRRWAEDPSIACVVLDGAGEKAFCAGGDVRFLRHAAMTHQGPGPNLQAQAFFAEEYRLDHRIHTYPKPILLWGSGIVMGGGLGLLAGASHRVVTETSRFAMPEISIGLFPDVGGSWFLPRMPGRVGLFLSLTGAAFNGADARFLGLGDHLLATADRGAVLGRLAETAWTCETEANHARLTELLGGFSGPVGLTSPVQRHAETIEHLTQGATLAEVRAKIIGYDGDEPWLQKAGRTLGAGSPTTAALIWELHRKARHLSLAEVFRLELIVALVLRAPGFFRGRARAADRQGSATPLDSADARGGDRRVGRGALHAALVCIRQRSPPLG